MSCCGVVSVVSVVPLNLLLYILLIMFVYSLRTDIICYDLMVSMLRRDADLSCRIFIRKIWDKSSE